MINSLTKEIIIGSRDVSMSNCLRPSAALQLFQDISVEHATALGYGHDMTRKNGLMWIIIKNHLLITRAPLEGERVTVTTWVTKQRHVMFPRYCRMTDAAGNVLIDGAAMWVLADTKTRQLAFPDRYGVVQTGDNQGFEIPILSPIRKAEPACSTTVDIPYSYIDMNHHVNNTRYIDIAEDCLGLAENGHSVKELLIEYLHETHIHDRLKVSWSLAGDAYLMNGSTDTDIFCMELKYD